jgi:lysophospholipase L1-like esterase
MNTQQIIDNTLGVTLAAALTAVATSATLAAGMGARFPLRTDGSYYPITFTGGTTETTYEQCRTIGVASGDVIPLTNRGESGTNQAWAVGDKCEVRANAKVFNTIMALAMRQIYASSQVVTVGDSFLAFGEDATLGTLSSSVIGWVNDYMRAGGGVGFDVTTRLAVNGYTLEQVISTQLGSAAATAARTVWFHAGVNDLNATTANNDTIAAMIPLFKQIFDTLCPVKDLVIVEGLSPINQAGTGTAGVRAYQHEAVNALLGHLCAQYPNILFLNPYDATLDFTSNALNPVTNATRPDGIHPSSLGARLIARSYASKIIERVQLTRYKTKGVNLAPAFPQDAGGTVTPGTFITVTGAPPTGWELLGVSGAAATLACTVSSVAPDMTRFVFNNTGGTTATTYLRASNLQGALASGSLVQAGFGFQTHDNTGLNRLAVSLRENGTTVFSGMAAGGQENPVVYPQVAHCGFRCTPPWALPAAPTNLELIIQMSVLPGLSTIDIYAPELNLLT